MKHLILSEIKYATNARIQIHGLLVFIIPFYLLLSFSPFSSGFVFDITLKDILIHFLFFVSGTTGLISSRMTFYKKEKRGLWWMIIPPSKRQRTLTEYLIVLIYHLPAVIAISVYGVILSKSGAMYSPSFYINLFLILLNVCCLLLTGFSLRPKGIFGKHSIFLIAGFLQLVYLYLYSNSNIQSLLNSAGLTLPLILTGIGSIDMLVSRQLNPKVSQQSSRKGQQEIKYKRWKGVWALILPEHHYLYPKSFMVVLLYGIVLFILVVIGRAEKTLEGGFIEHSAIISLFAIYPVMTQLGLLYESKYNECRNTFFLNLPVSRRHIRNSNLISLIMVLSLLLPIYIVFAWLAILNPMYSVPLMFFPGLMLMVTIVLMFPFWLNSRFLKLSYNGMGIISFIFAFGWVVAITSGNFSEELWLQFLTSPFWIFGAVVMLVFLLYNTADALVKNFS